ncbi:hypothetical protein PO124_30535 [Bacillus licheniformis]|nr:hypothetical protein [Bacillus licheniformis]
MIKTRKRWTASKRIDFRDNEPGHMANGLLVAAHAVFSNHHLKHERPLPAAIDTGITIITKEMWQPIMRMIKRLINNAPIRHKLISLLLLISMLPTIGLGIYRDGPLKYY